jgi:hypothetical protein
MSMHIIFSVVVGVVLGISATSFGQILVNPTIETYMHAAGKQPNGNWIPIPLDKDGNVICHIEQK